MSNPFLDQTPHPAIRPIPIDQLSRVAEASGADAALELVRKREEIIAAEKADPFQNGWEPPIWYVADCMFGFPWVPKSEATAMRKALGVPNPERPMQVGYLLGANRSSKTHYCVTRVLRVIYLIEKITAYCFHEEGQRSIDDHQALMWDLFPRQYKASNDDGEVKAVRKQVGYIAYKEETGFSRGKGFQFPHNRSKCRFGAYSEELKKYEGGKPKIVWGDENIPAAFLETLRFRVAQLGGWAMVSYTPIDGWNSLVASAVEGAKVLKTSPAFVLPADTGDAWGEALDHVQDCRAWLTGGTGYEAIAPDLAETVRGDQSFYRSERRRVAGTLEFEERLFESVPRVMLCADPQKFVLFFHGSDNPFGSPRQVYATAANMATATRRIRLYGVAEKGVSAALHNWNPAVHVVKERPTKGLVVQIIDPCPGRNWFMIWVQIHNGRATVIREWPSAEAMPGVHEYLGPWAEPSRTDKQRDGAPGPAQKRTISGYLNIKKLIAAIEGWRDYQDDLPDNQAVREIIKGWTPQTGTALHVTARYMDSRYAAAPTMTKEEHTTGLEEMLAVGLPVMPTPGNKIDEGIEILDDLLSYDRQQPIDPIFNHPRLQVHESCKNLIFACGVWTGADGQKGATKDPIDALRYFATLDLLGLSADGMAGTSGGYH